MKLQKKGAINQKMRAVGRETEGGLRRDTGKPDEEIPL